jgi:tyrosyl-tRNA synthetase
MHELFYPLMQGYDAYALQADVQVGGTDQLFNIVTASRKVMASLGVRPNIAIIMGILPGTDGVIKMSKSLGNHIPMHTSAEDMFGKVMSIPDFAMPVFARLVTRWTPDQLAEFEAGLAAGQHPRDAKMVLAREITACFYDDLAADRAGQAFVRTFQQHELPAEIPEYTTRPGESILDILVASRLIASRSEGRRLLDQKGVRFNGQVLTSGQAELPGPGVLQVGRRHFLRIVNP